MYEPGHSLCLVLLMLPFMCSHWFSNVRLHILAYSLQCLCRGVCHDLFYFEDVGIAFCLQFPVEAIFVDFYSLVAYLVILFGIIIIIIT